MVVIFIAIALIVYSIILVIQLIKGTHSTQVHSKNKVLKAENERLKEQLKSKN